MTTDFIIIIFFFTPHLLTSVHLLAIAVAVARIGVDADQGAAGVRLVARRNRQGRENWQGVQEEASDDSILLLALFFFSFSPEPDWRPPDAGNKTQAGPTVPVMELRTSLEKDVSTEFPWRVTDVTPPPMLRSSREPWWRWRRRRHDWIVFLCFDVYLISINYVWILIIRMKVSIRDKTNWSFNIRHVWRWQKSSFKDLSLSYLGTVSVILMVSYFSCVCFPFNSCTLCFCNFSWPCTACWFVFISQISFLTHCTQMANLQRVSLVMWRYAAYLQRQRFLQNGKINVKVQISILLI